MRLRACWVRRGWSIRAVPENSVPGFERLIRPPAASVCIAVQREYDCFDVLAGSQSSALSGLR